MKKPSKNHFKTSPQGEFEFGKVPSPKGEVLEVNIRVKIRVMVRMLIFLILLMFHAEADTGYRSPSLREGSLAGGGVSHW